MEDKTKQEGTIPSRRSIRMRSAFDVNRLLSRTINQLLRDEVSEAKAGKIGYLCNVMLKSFELTDIEQRIRKLEEQSQAGSKL